MGALPGSGFLTGHGGQALHSDETGKLAGLFDVESFRGSGRLVVVRSVDRPLLVLGSTQPTSDVDEGLARRRGITVARRRSGGGAVLLVPGNQLWVDVWLPRTDPLWSGEPRRSAELVGRAWASALAGAGASDLAVHDGAAPASPDGRLVCFAAMGAGEVTAAGRKMVGLAQWRSRQGVLVHGCTYLRWDPGPLLDLLGLDDDRRSALSCVLERAVVGLDDVGAGSLSAAAVAGALPGPVPWSVSSD